MRKFRHFRHVCRIAVILILLCLPAAAQVTFSGKITVNTVNSTVDLANPAYYDANSRCLPQRCCDLLPSRVGGWLERWVLKAIHRQSSVEPI